MTNPPPKQLACLDLFEACVRAIQNGELIEPASSRDKEFHFQDWFEKRLTSVVGDRYLQAGRNTYPDFALVGREEGFELKGLACPGRDRSYDCNSQVPSGFHRGLHVHYVFGRYPKDTAAFRPAGGGPAKYPVIDLVMCHGDFLNCNHHYVHKNRSFRGFGSYGDILVRDRKMYVAPTPFALAEGTTGVRTLILPAEWTVDERVVQVGELRRTEAAQLVVGYSFDLQSNEIAARTVPNPSAGKVHDFKAYRLAGDGDKPVTMVAPAVAAAAVAADLPADSGEEDE